MRVRAIQKHVPYVGPYGAEKDMDSRSAKVLILLGRVEEVKPPPRPKRTYKRRDMVVEQVDQEMIIPEEEETDEVIPEETDEVPEEEEDE